MTKGEKAAKVSVAVQFKWMRENGVYTRSRRAAKVLKLAMESCFMDGRGYENKALCKALGIPATKGKARAKAK